MMPSTETGLAARVEQLTEEVNYYKRELGMVRDSERVGTMQARFRFTTREAAVCDVLLAKAPGATVEKNALFEAAWGDRAYEVEMKILDVFICKIRAKIGRDAIETVWGTGYRLSSSGRELLVSA